MNIQILNEYDTHIGIESHQLPNKTYLHYQNQ